MQLLLAILGLFFCFFLTFELIRFVISIIIDFSAFDEKYRQPWVAGCITYVGIPLIILLIAVWQGC